MKYKKTYRHSRQRDVILEELRKVCAHPTANTLYGMVRKRLPRISLGTVYRNLDLLAEQGEIVKFPCAGGQTCFDGNPKKHAHMRCTQCGRLIDIESKITVSYNNPVTDEYEITSHRVELFGLCAKCKNKQQPFNQ